MGIETLPADVRAHIAAHRELYLRSGGAQGQIRDARPSGAHYFGTSCLIRYKGRKSGRTMITPLSYGAIGGEVVIVGSKGGSPDHPQWYLNIRDAGEIDFQIATQAFRATLREPEGAEREKVWNFISDCYPFYLKYQARAPRIIPIVMMKAFEEIPVFKESDITPAA